VSARRFLSSVNFYCGGARVGTGRWLLTTLTQVRFLPPQLRREILSRRVEAIRPDEGPVLKTGSEHDSLVGSSPTASAGEACPWPSGRGAGLPSRRGGFNSRRALLFRHCELMLNRHVLENRRLPMVALPFARIVSQSLGDRLTVGFLPLKQAMKVRILLPELC
jgi:hypothetical protein